MADPKSNKWPESHYSLNTLGKWFFVASVLLLVSLLLIFHFDYATEWKKYQKTFRELEAEKTKALVEQEKARIDADQSYQDAKKQADEQQAALKGKQAEHETLVAAARRAEEHYQHQLQNFQYAKADYDALKYAYEAARAGHGSGVVEDLQKDYEAAKVKKEALELESQRAETLWKDAKKVEDRFVEDMQKSERALRALSSQLIILERKLKQVDFAAMDFENRVGNTVRDWPVLDMLSPYYKIDQIVVKDIQEDLNFTKVPKVDRCTTCHQGVLKPGFENAPQPFRTHPKLDMFLSSTSPHPIEQFACTSCHQGRGRGTSFASAAHTPRSPEQAKEWEEKYDWHAIHDWDQPMLPLNHVQASCLKCHNQETSIKGADQLNLGLKLVEKAGCYACHKIDKFASYPKPGPSLVGIKDKLKDKNWTYNWIHHPHQLRHNAWMPHYFDQANNSDEASLLRSQQEVQAMVAYLYHQSAGYDMKPLPKDGDVAKGKELVASVGCYACHQQQSDATLARDLSLKGLLREQGPNLIGMGAKTQEQWIFNWLKDPKSYHATTRMPSLRLSDKEAADMAAYLVRDAATNSADLKPGLAPAVNENILNAITTDFMKKTMSSDQSQEALAKMSTEDKQLYSGERLVRHYGCASCHDIAGLEKTLPIGPELNGVASKSLHLFDFGFVHISHTVPAWLTQKVKDPRSFDEGRILQPLDKLIMPNFEFNDAEAEAVVTALLGLVKMDAGVKLPEHTIKSQHVQEGQELIRQLNCQGCHLIEDEGAAVLPTVEEWLVTYQDKTPKDAQAMAVSFSAPNLIGEGAKVQPDWLFHFLHEPTTIRPWLSMRMPTYGLSDNEANTLVKYFSYREDQKFPFEQQSTKPNSELLEAGHKLASPEYFDCGNCHIQGDKMPAGEPDRWAPNLSLAHDRLKPEWIAQWLYDPQKLLPGTKMPTYFDPAYFDATGPEDILGGDEHKHIKALAEYVRFIDTFVGQANLVAAAPMSTESEEKTAVCVEPAVESQNNLS